MRIMFVTALLTLVAATADAQVVGYGVALECDRSSPLDTRGWASATAAARLARSMPAAASIAWIGDRAGVRFELRDHVRPDDRGLTHYWAARLGIVFK